MPNHNNQKKIAHQRNRLAMLGGSAASVISLQLGVQCACCPTSVLSNHTGCHFQDFTPLHARTSRRWRKLGLRFPRHLSARRADRGDAGFIDEFGGPDCIVMVDPS